MQGRPARRLRHQVQGGPHLRVGFGQRREAVGQCAVIQHRAADQQRHPAAGADVVDALASASRRNRPAEYGSDGSQMSMR